MQEVIKIAESLREVINRMKNQNSQTSVPTNKSTRFVPKSVPMPPVQEDEEEYEEEEIEEEDEEVKEVPKKKKAVPIVPDQTQLADQIRNLQDNGIYRLEKLSVLHQINNNLKVIAGVLVDLSGVK